MYDWKDIALMYKDELEKILDEAERWDQVLGQSSEIRTIRVQKEIDSQLNETVKSYSFIESFESSASNTKKFASKPAKKLNAGRYVNANYVYDESISEKINEYVGYLPCANILLGKLCTYGAIKWLQGMGFSPDSHKCMTRDDNVIEISDKSGKVRTVKVLGSSMEFSGKTVKFDSEDELISVPKQHTYLLNPKEPIYDAYIFAHWSNSNSRVTIYAQIKGKHIKSMLVEPLRERFRRKFACILEKDCYNRDKTFYTIDKLLKGDSDVERTK